VSHSRRTMSSSCAAGFEHVPEQRTPVDLQIHGVIPPWLSGVLYRTGPGTTRIPTTADPSKVVEIQHWFDGLALHHRFEIFPGGERVSYRSHNGSDDLERQIAEAGRYPTLSFGQRKDPCQAIFRNFSAAFQAMRAMGVGSPSPSGVNVSVTLTPDMPGLGAEISGLSTPSGARYIVAKSDANALQIIDPETLEPLLATTYEQLDPRLDGPLSAAHSCRDQETGDFYNYSCKFGARFPTYKIFRIGGKDGKVDVLAEIKDAPPSYVHSFAMTKRFVVLCVWQAHMKRCVHVFLFLLLVHTAL
jgi:torulene dioxygenase